MKLRTIPAAVALWVLATAVGLTAENPNMGTWTLDEAKSDIPAGMAKNTKVVYTKAADDMIKITVEGTDGAGKPFQTTWTGKIDGKPYKVEGSSTYDEIAYTKADDRTTKLTTTKGGEAVATGTIAVAPDGKTRVVTVTMEVDGKKNTSKAAYTKE